jgi:hypothetical protein
VTVPNVAVNARRHATWPPKSRFFAGDWASLGNVITDDKECSKYVLLEIYYCNKLTAIFHLS